jgi:thiol peroxidase
MINIRMERTGIFKFRDADVTIVGPDLQPGQSAPEFTAHTPEFKTVRALADTAGKVRVIAALPSLNTAVCDRETRRFNVEAAALGSAVAILVLSTDLPFAIKNWCAAAGVDQVQTLSDHLDANFGEKYGCLIKELRILRRAVFVVDRAGVITYAAYMPALGVEPDYDQVLAAARAALGQSQD